MKTIALLFYGLVICNLASGQGTWTWIKGSNTAGGVANYGVKGVSAPGNVPPAMYEAADWTDSAGNFWIFGGLGSGFAEYSDLWKFDPIAGNWTWVNGAGYSGASGSYGMQGVPSSNNRPPVRSWGVATWTDLDNNLWLYGGSNGSLLSDLWRYNIATNEWTWMQGSQGGGVSAVYGLQGIPSQANTPGARFECSATWVDSLGNLWLFGGLDGSSTLNDLWMYNIKTNEWTWMSGASSFNQTGTYGVQGVFNPANVPGSRQAYCSWKDAKGKFWLFGGTTNNAASNFNDMWEYDPSINEWAWVSGSNSTGSQGNYGNTCASSTSFAPTGRIETRARWVDECGRFWLFGGWDRSSTDKFYDDLWIFDPFTLQWTLEKGSPSINVPPVYGTMGVPSQLNLPGGRAGSVGWKGKNGTLYLFGGTVNSWLNPYNDLWTFQADPNCPAGTTFINLGRDTIYCGPFNRVLSTSYSNTVWSTGITGPQITVTTAGKYWATVNSSCGVASDTIILSSQPRSLSGVVSRGRDSICAGSGVTSHLSDAGSNGTIQWQSSSDGVYFSNIPAATSANYITPPTLSHTTFYRVFAKGNCGNDSSNIVVVHIVPAPQAKFIYTARDKDVTFNSAGTSSDVTSYYWDFGDSTTSTTANPAHHYNHTDTFYVCLTVYNNSNCSYTICKYVNLLNTGIAAITENNFIQLYPNPANNLITLSTDGLQGKYQLKIYDMLGKLVYSQIIDFSGVDKNIIDLTNFTEGSYNLVLLNNKEYYNQKFVHLK